MQYVVCKKIADGSSASEDMCDAQQRMQEKQRQCNTEPCPSE